MKMLISISLLVFSFSVFAQDGDKFAEHKKMMLENMSQQMASMQTHKSCVEAAADMSAVKKCQETAKDERKKMAAARIDQKIKKLDEEKKHLEEKKEEKK